MSNHALPRAERHGPIEEIFTDAWFVTGSVVFKPLVRLARNMVILRAGGDLTVINAVRLSEAGEAVLDSLGAVKHVVQIGIHGMDNRYYVQRYGAELWSVSGKDNHPTHVLSAETQLPVPDTRIFMFEKTNSPEAAILFEREGGLLITCDSVQHWAPHPLMSVAARLITLVMGFRNPAQIGPPWMKFQTPPGGTLKGDFQRLVALPFDSIIGGHGGLLKEGGQARLGETIDRVFG